MIAPREELLQEIRDLATKLGRTPALRDSGTLAGRASSLFGNWSEALAAAGLEPAAAPSRAKSTPVPQTAPPVEPEPAETVFGVADLTGQKPDRATQTRKHARNPWTRDEVIAALKADAKQRGRPPSATHWFKAGDGRPTHSAVQRIFGSWSKGLEAAGLSAVQPGHTRRPPKARAARPAPPPSPAMDTRADTTAADNAETRLENGRALSTATDTPTLAELERAALNAELTYHIIRAQYLRERIRLHGTTT